MSSPDILAIFAEALAQPTDEDRARLLEQACHDKPQERQRIEALLAAHFQAGRFLAGSHCGSPPSPMQPISLLAEGRQERLPPMPVTRAEPGCETIGARIGPYKLLQIIGEGGMGVVYMAEQQEPLGRRVALKIIKPGMDSRQVIARFEAERQALAMMDHPHIAKVFDAGTTDGGRPYFVMELVKGIPFNQYCDQGRLSIRDRLQLFIPVCGAIQHAHHKGIIHRDIKPPNILVARYDDVAGAKVIDFGVAKATQQLSDKTMFTQFGQVIGTLEYMSPEQAQFNQLDIDTRSDVYSLGVVLYELLTGTTPLNSRNLKSAAYDELLRIIREDNPPLPSTRLSSSGTLPAIAANRSIEPARLHRYVRGELEWIVMKALEKDRSRRYETASDLARDLECFLRGEPVSAGRPSRSYRARKFVHRNRVLIVGTMMTAVALVAGTIASLRQAHGANQARNAALASQSAEAKQRGIAEQNADEARQAAAESRAILKFFETHVLAAARPARQEGGLGSEASILAAISAAEPQINSTFQDQPRAEASVRNTLGLTYHYLGRLDEALAQYRRSYELRLEHLGPDHVDTQNSANNVAVVYKELGRHAEAIPILERLLRQSTTALGADDPSTLTSINNLASAYAAAGRKDEALKRFKQVYEGRKARLGAEHIDTLGAMNNLASVYIDTRQIDEAVILLQQCLQTMQRTIGIEHPDALKTLNNLALAYRKLGRHDDALAMAEQSYRVRAAIQGPRHPDTLRAMGNLGAMYWHAGKLDKSVPILEEALDSCLAELGPGNDQTIRTAFNLAVNYRDCDRLAEAEQTFDEWLPRANAILSPNNDILAFGLRQAAATYTLAKRFDKGELVLRQLVTLTRDTSGSDSTDYADGLELLGFSLVGQKKYVESEVSLRECLRIRQEREPGKWKTFYTESLLGECLAGQKKFAEAEPLLLSSYAELMKREADIPPSRLSVLDDASGRIVKLYDDSDRKQQADEWRAKNSQP